eukprot:TRINITY_DN305_c0_g1_i2.p1 TRINITY_DN305_c0_g1~~TRINITY_DN305_c0_g1_i2.p1  ORF type:complete len:197 (+),score=42.99 TRINITY_DN305_c0_g1_i2:98-688(+)
MSYDHPNPTPVNPAEVQLRNKSICVFCGSSDDAPEQHRQEARDLAALFAEANCKLVYGGSTDGLMGVVSAEAHSLNVHVIGVRPVHFVAEKINTKCEYIPTQTLHERKKKMFDLSDAFVILPGGPGTMDEFFEVLTWKKIGLHDKPLFVVNVEGYYNPLLSLVDQMITHRYASEASRQLFLSVSSVKELAPFFTKS